MRRWLVRDVMTTPVVTVTEATSYRDVVDRLMDSGASGVPVVDGDMVVGVITEADLLCRMEYGPAAPQRRLIERKRHRVGRGKADGVIAADMMTTPAITTGPTVTLAAAARVMDAERIKRLPVVDTNGHLVGIVSRRDLLRVYLRDDDAVRDEIVDRVLGQTLWIGPEHVQVTVDHSVVTLSGTVDRKSTIPIVVGLVGAVDGVTEVVNHLTYHYADDRHPLGA